MQTGTGTGGAAGGASGATTMADLIAEQKANQLETMKFQSESGKLQREFMAHSAAEKNKTAMSQNINALVNAESQAAARA